MGPNFQDLDLKWYLWQQFGLFFLFNEKKKAPQLETTTIKNALKASVYGKPPFRYVFTYHNLINDIHLFEKKSNERIRLFMSMIKAVGWDSGFVFIPCTKFKENKILDYSDFFWKKVFELKVSHPISHILIFGKEARRILLPNAKISGFGLFKHNNIYVMILPSPEEMLPDNRVAKNIVWNFLKQLKSIKNGGKQCKKL